MPSRESRTHVLKFLARTLRKKKEQIQGRTNTRMPICNPTIPLVIANLYIKFEVSILNGCGDIFDIKFWRDRKKNKYREEQIGEGPFSIP